MLIRFLIPINFEAYSLSAIKYCMLLAQKFQGEITLLHSFSPVLDNDVDEIVDLSSEMAYAKLAQIKEEAVKSCCEDQSIVIITRVEEGYPEDVIPSFCKEYCPDLIVMGTKSKGETIKELLGSVTLDVIRNVDNPVLVVPKDYDLNLNKLNNILFLTDFCKCEYTSLHKLVRLIMSFDTVIHNVQYCSGGKEKADVEMLNEYSGY